MSRCSSAPWADFGGSIVVEAGPCGNGESNSEKDITYERDLLCGIFGERSVGGVVDAAGQLLVRMYYHVSCPILPK